MACCLLPCPALCQVSCCTCCGGGGAPRAGRWRYVYFFCFSASVLLSWVLRDYYAPSMRVFPALKSCETEACFGKQAVLRVSLGTCLFFSVMCVAMLGVRHPDSRRGRLHTRCFALMLPAWAGLVVLCFLPDNAVMNTYFQAARAGGAAFLLLQLIILLDVVYETNEKWLEQDDGPSRAKLVTGASITNAGTIAGIVCMFVYLGVSPRDYAFISVTLVLFVLFTVLSLLPQVSGGVFTSGAVSAYCLYLCATAILSDPAHAGAPPRWLQAVGFVIALCALLHATFSATGGARSFDVAPAARSPRSDEEEEPDDVHPLSYSFFHLVFALGAMYAAMLFTSWSPAEAFAVWHVDKGEASMWVKIGCEWAAASLYIWMLVAPLACRGRDFS